MSLNKGRWRRTPPDRDGWWMFDEDGTGEQRILVIDGCVADDTDWEHEVGHSADLDGLSWNYWEGNPVKDMTDGTLTEGTWKYIGPMKTKGSV